MGLHVLLVVVPDGAQVQLALVRAEGGLSIPRRLHPKSELLYPLGRGL
jgi:hypothetical protein